MGNYSNGWGHLIATIGVMGFSAFALWSGKLASDTVMAIMSPVITFWFMAGTLNRFANSQAPASSSTTTTTTTASQQGQQWQGVTMP